MEDGHVSMGGEQSPPSKTMPPPSSSSSFPSSSTSTTSSSCSPSTSEPTLRMDDNPLSQDGQADGGSGGGAPLKTGYNPATLAQQSGGQGDSKDQALLFGVYVDHIPHTWKENNLRAIFDQFGTITRCKVMADQTSGRSLGFGFVHFSSQEECDRAILTMNNFELGGSYIQVRPAKKKYNDDQQQIVSSNIYVSGLRSNISEEELRKMFTPWGNILSVNLLQSKPVAMGDDPSYRGVGFVHFETVEEASEACRALNGTKPQGAESTDRILTVKPARPRKQHNRYSSRGHRMYRGGGRARGGRRGGGGHGPSGDGSYPYGGSMGGLSPVGMAPQSFVMGVDMGLGMGSMGLSGRGMLGGNGFYSPGQLPAMQVGSGGMAGAGHMASGGYYQPMMGGGGHAGGRRQQRAGPESTLFVYHLPNTMTEDQLVNLFAAYGPITKATIIRDKATNISKGYGFVTYEYSEDGQTAIQYLNGHKVGNKYLSVSVHKPKSSRH